MRQQVALLQEQVRSFIENIIIHFISSDSHVFFSTFIVNVLFVPHFYN